MCRRDRGILAKSADIWLSGRHVADMLATFSAKTAKALELARGKRAKQIRSQLNTKIARLTKLGITAVTATDP